MEDPSQHRITFYPWQLEAKRRLTDGSGAPLSSVLSAPTGAGKTLVAYLWAGLLDESGTPKLDRSGCDKVIFTAPIKALSNERYMDLLKMGFDVGIETGDFKKNADAPVICCTQEIYDLKYAGRDGLCLIIDEFHYIFSENERSRAYIDGLRKTHPAVPILVMSATFGQPDEIRAYLERVMGRPFELYVLGERITKLTVLNHSQTAREIHDALVFAFSQKGVHQVADMIAAERMDIDRNRKARLRDLAWILEVNTIQRNMFKGVGVYYGRLLPKEKLLVERAYRERIIDVVVGTDALALGVNLPAETVVFAQTVRYFDRRPISKTNFSQMAGRAGRKGLFDEGFVTWLEDSPVESRGVDIGKMFKALEQMPAEKASIQLRPDFGAILKKHSTVENEAEIVSNYSLPQLRCKTVATEIRDAVKQIDRSLELLAPGQKDRFKKILADVWYGEMEVEQNLEMAELFFRKTNGGEKSIHPDGMIAAELFQKYEKNFLQALLRVKRYNNALPEAYRFSGMNYVEAAIEEIDPTVFGFEDRILEMDSTAVNLPEARIRLVPGDRTRLERRRRHAGRHKKMSPVQKNAAEKREKQENAPAKKRRFRRRRKKPRRPDDEI
ncbi:MAG: DEAD/DEAH box helicase [Pyramidobacter sp.]|jgi:superfamily II RNA helicase